MRPVVVTPTYDERENLPHLVEQVLHHVPHAHLLAVDDGSPDGTGQVADALAARDPRVHVLHRASKDGLGRAYLAGFRWALARDYTHVCEMDADLSHRPVDLPRLLAAAEHADLVLGCRYMPGGGTENWGRHRQLISRAGNRYARGILGLTQRDLTGGFKCFRRRVLEGIDLGGVRSEGYSFQVELTWRAHRAGFAIVEVPITFVERRAGQSKMSWAIVREAAWRMGWLRLRG